MIIGNLIMGNPKEPSRKRKTHITVAADGFQSLEEYPACQILSIMYVPRAEVNVVIDSLYIVLVELSKCFRICFCALNQLAFLFSRVHSNTQMFSCLLGLYR